MYVGIMIGNALGMYFITKLKLICSVRSPGFPSMVRYSSYLFWVLTMPSRIVDARVAAKMRI
jgi:hypothetical protein